jgi:hypothetical protein
MKKKSAAKNKVKPKSKKPVNLVDQLHKCIQADQAKLHGVYAKLNTKADKGLARTAKALEKAEKQLAKMKAKKGNKKPVDKTATSTLLALEKEHAALKAEKASLSDGHKKFIAQQKVLQTFEKEWNKKKPKLSTKGKGKRGQAQSVESNVVDIQQPLQADLA